MKYPARMPVRPVTDPADPALAPYANLHGLRGRVQAALPEGGRAGAMICEGRFLVQKALETPHLRVLSVVGSDEMIAALQPYLRSDTEVLRAGRTLVEELSGFAFHRGVMACVACPPLPPEERLLAVRKLVVLPRLDGVDNLGAILRSAAALGVEGVLVGAAPDVFDRRTVRVSMGACWSVPVWQTPGWAQLLERWRRAAPDTEVVGAALAPGAMPVAEWRPAARTALLLGHEGYGLAPAQLALCDRPLVIPMRAGMDSLNVAACAAILMHRMMG